MNSFVAVRLRKLSVIYWANNPLELNLKPTERIVVTTQHGVELGTVMRIAERKTEGIDEESDQFIISVERRANADDLAKLPEIAEKEKEAFLKSRELIEKHELPMKLLKAEYLFDYSRLILYFKSDNKVDFRELLKSLASAFKTRIELRQIGVRDETKLLGGLGCCGKQVCCSQFMNAFYPVSTKMAKEQNLSLNPAKLSGICGRLLCCLGHEHEYYASFHGKFPKIGAEVVIGDEIAKVVDINYITKKAVLGFVDRRKITYSFSDVKGRRDAATGRNLWWIQLEGDPEPDLSALLKNLNPPGTGKKKRKNQDSDDIDDSDETDDFSE